jgi:DNA end-binding protein Ku
MHFEDEIVEQSTLDFPEIGKPAENEMKVAKMLIDTMTEAFDASKFKDTYKEQILAMIDARAAGKETPKAETSAPKASNVVNLMDMLQRSLEQTKKRTGSVRASDDASDEAEEKPKKTAARRKRSAA